MTIDESIRLHDVIRAACDASGLRRIELTGSSQRQRIVYWRQLAMQVAHVMTDASLGHIATAFGRADHTTALWAIRKVTCARMFAVATVCRDADTLEASAREIASIRVAAARAHLARIEEARAC